MNITEIIKLSSIGYENCKIHLASGPSDKRQALNEYYQGTFKTWQEWQNQKNFEREYIISFAQLSSNEWLFLGIYKRLGVIKKDDGYHYDTEIVNIGNDMCGRLVLAFNKEFRQSYLLAENYIEQFEVIEILREKMVMDRFPGYENVYIDYRTLQTIIRTEEKSWYTALANVTGIYLIVDGNNGKLYVGSATGNENFWQRWSDYANTFHGNNEKLKQLRQSHDEYYFDSIFYTILEIYNNKTDSQYVLDREYFWQKILKTKEYGYN